MNQGKDPRMILQGAKNRAAGETFEQMLRASCNYYHMRGLAAIEKTPEPVKQLSKMNREGRFLACYERRAQPDFKGTITGGRSVVFEAKHTSTGKMEQNEVKQWQADAPDLHEKLGAWCFVIVSFGMVDCYRVPWAVWKRMKELYGRKYITPADVREYKIPQPGGLLRFLEAGAGPK